MRSRAVAPVAAERNGSRSDPKREVKAWLHKLADVNRKRSGFQDMAAEGLITLDELRGKLTDLEETRKTAERELKALRDRAERTAVLERDMDALLASFGGAVPETLDKLTPEERSQLYKMLKLRLVGGTNGTLRLEGVFYGDADVCTIETLS